MPPIVLTFIAYLVGGYEAAGLMAFVTVGLRIIHSMYPDQPPSVAPPSSEWKSIQAHGIYIQSSFPAACAGVRITELYSLPLHPCMSAPPPPSCAYPRCNATTRVDYCP